jgi:predicted O-linked N-acetylglucosamine transferase (SPINDLY family)
VGYVSPDFINHAVARFIEPVLSDHDRSRFEVFCYSNAQTPDTVTARLRALSEHWRDTALLDDAQTAALIREDRIDLLVDLAGHTAGNQLLVFARKPAPVQITWIGYPNTTGMGAMDYRLTDAIADPPGLSEAFHREQLVRLPGPFSCYLPSAESPDVNPLPALSAGHVTFGSFNQFAKLTPAVVELWARLLRECPSAHLLLRARSLADNETASRLRETFARLGVDPGRLELDGSQLSVAAHQGCYHRVDLALDPFPYNGTTTTCEALWMGVPVIALAGRTHVARVGASLLTHLGTPEWIAQSPDDYIERCRALASDLPKLAAIRAGLRARFRASPLGDAKGFTRNLETTYATLWARRVE